MNWMMNWCYDDAMKMTGGGERMGNAGCGIHCSMADTSLDAVGTDLGWALA